VINHYLQGLRERGIALTDCYPYAAFLADPLRQTNPDWFALFVKDDLGAQLPMNQARNFAFVAFVEQHWPEELDKVLVSVIEQGPPYWAAELANTYRWYCSEEID